MMASCPIAGQKFATNLNKQGFPFSVRAGFLGGMRLHCFEQEASAETFLQDLGQASRSIHVVRRHFQRVREISHSTYNRLWQLVHHKEYSEFHSVRREREIVSVLADISVRKPNLPTSTGFGAAFAPPLFFSATGAVTPASPSSSSSPQDFIFVTGF
jgi:hypothetical protein